MWAITPSGIGKPVTARAIEPEWDLIDGEAFKVEHWNPDLVLAENGVSLRTLNQSELDAAAVEAARDAVKLEISAIELQEIMPRKTREIQIQVMEYFASTQGLTPEQLYAVNPAYRGMVDVNNEIIGLRAQL